MNDFNLEITKENEIIIIKTSGYLNNIGGEKISEACYSEIENGAKYFLLSHMRGHIADMDKIVSICNSMDISLIEDCAHTMGAKWNGVRSGNFGTVSAFSTQTYKHMNSGEGGFLTTNNPELAAKAVVSSGSYMLYDRHGAIPAEKIFRKIRHTF